MMMTSMLNRDYLELIILLPDLGSPAKCSFLCYWYLIIWPFID